MDLESAAELSRYLAKKQLIASTDEIAFRLLSGGVSNKVVWIRLPDGREWVLKQSLRKLRVVSDWFSDPTRILVEAEGIRYLSGIVKDHVPGLVFVDRDELVLAMFAVPEPRLNWKECLLNGAVDLGLVGQFAELLARIHEAGKAPENAERFHDRRHFEDLRLAPYYEVAASKNPGAQSFLEDLIAETRRQRYTIVHGDFSPKNIIVHQGRLHLVDHEVIHFGDGAFDVGFALTHLLGKANHLKSARMLEAAEHFWRIYQKKGCPSAAIAQRALRHGLGCLLARVDGRSPLEYLSEENRTLQRQSVLDMMARAPVSVSDLIQRFGRSVHV